MPQHIRTAVIAVLSTVVATQALAQGKSDESNGVPHVIQEALANGINVDVTNSPAVTVENQVDVSVVGETEVVVTNASPIEVTVSNFPDTSGGGGDESGYVGVTSIPMDGQGGPLARARQCQFDYGIDTRICGIPDLLETKAITFVADDMTGIGSTVWTLKNGNDATAFNLCTDNRSNRYGSVYSITGFEGRASCNTARPVACCR